MARGGTLVARGRSAVPKLPSLSQVTPTTSHGLASTTRLLHMGLWAFVVLAGLGGLKSLMTPAAKSAAPPKAAVPTVGPEGFAELFVATYLSAGQGTEASLRPFYPEPVELREVTSGALYAARTTTLEARAMGERYWSVTVGADVLSSDAGGYRPLGTRYYQVAVAGSPNGGFVAASLPAQVPAPLVARAPALGTGSMESPRPDDAVAQAVSRFAAAYLTGNGELVRYSAPDANLRPVLPAPFTAVQLTRLGSRSMPDTARQVLAELRATDSAGRVEFLHYALELAQRAGRWEVRAVMPAPPLAAPAGDTSTTVLGRPAAELSALTTTTSTTTPAIAGVRPPAPSPTTTRTP